MKFIDFLNYVSVQESVIKYLSASHLSWKCTEPALPLFWVQVTQVWTLLSGVCISNSVSVQLLESALLVFTVPSFSAGLFCPVRFVCDGSCPCHHSLVSAVLPGLLFVWARNDLQWRQDLHGFPIWMSFFESQDPEKEQFGMPRILIEISDNFPRAWSGIVATSFRIWEIWIFCRLLLDHGGLTL